MSSSVEGIGLNMFEKRTTHVCTTCLQLRSRISEYLDDKNDKYSSVPVQYTWVHLWFLLTTQ